jgi:hypothetical protein
MDLQSLPNELWLEIFEWAASDGRSSLGYVPFEILSGDSTDLNFGIKSTLRRVCRLWRDLVTAELLFRDIRIRYGQDGLRDALRTSSQGTKVYLYSGCYRFSHQLTGSTGHSPVSCYEHPDISTLNIRRDSQIVPLNRGSHSPSP